MSLQFESLTLKNFGPYRDLSDLNLVTTPESPIVVIHGENTLGKTRIFRALRWCLYGAPEAGKSPAESARSLNDYMNRLAKKDGESDMQVSIKFSANGQQYNLTRKATFSGGPAPTVTADLRIDSEVIQPASIDAEIGRLLHPQISEFFLFDGELLRDFYDRLNSDRERDLLKGSIESVLGIPALQMAARDITFLTDDVLARNAKAMRHQRDAENARRQLREINSRQESLDKDRAELHKSKREAEAALKEVNDLIASVDELKADVREMEMIESQIKGAEAEQQKLTEEMRRLVANGWLAPVSAKLSKVLDEVQKKNDEAEAKRKEVQVARDRVEVLRTQMAGGQCQYCHQELPPPSNDTKQDLADAESELSRLMTEVGDGPDLMRERTIRSLIDTTTISSYQEKQKRLNEIMSAQFDRNRRLGRIKDRLKDNDAAKIRQLANDQERLQKNIDGFSRKLRQIDETQSKLNTERNKVARALNRLSGSTPALAAETYFYQYVQDLVDRTIDRYQERTRAQVEATATAMFKKLIRDPEGYDGIEISKDYRLDLRGKHGPEMQTSEGGRQIIALSLIGALKQAAVRGGPVVLDSPLARLDLQHRENVLQRWVPELGSQAILLVQSGELTEEQAQKIMGNRVGQAYRIIRPNNDPFEATIERTQ